MVMALKKKPVTGMKDMLPREMEIRDYLIGLIKETYKTYGFCSIETPCVEHIENLCSKQGGDNEKLIFKILKRGEKLKIDTAKEENDLVDGGLRYDLTVPLARYYANHSNELPAPFKALQIGNVWRADRPQKGRFRQFMQCDIDILGEPGNLAEIELILATTAMLGKLSFQNFTVCINDRNILKAMAAYSGFREDDYDEVFIILDKMDKIGIVTGDGVRMRSGAGTSYSTIGYYNKGIQVKVTGKTGSWYAVSYNGLSGYMSADYVKLSTGNAVADKIVATAKQYLGTPYVYGGSSPRGFDCSGFMYYLYGQYGYSLWRGAGGQWNHNGTKVDKSDLQPGDLVFFSDSVDPIGHVGMYIGNNQFIHASSGKGCVVITSLSSSYYANHYTGAKRIIQ